MKNISAIALTVLFTIPHANANDAVAVYGIIDLGVQYLQQQQDLAGDFRNSTFLGMAGGVQSGSRFGLRGTSDLGDGTQVVFVLENGFNPGNGTQEQGGRLFGRQSTIGLTNPGVGRLDFGRQSNLATNYFLPLDPFSEGFGQANIGSSFGSANTLRYSNMALLQTPSFSGLTLGAGYSFSTGLTAIYLDNNSCALVACNISDAGYQYRATNNLRALTLGLKYQQGPVMLAAAFDKLSGPADVPNGPPPSSPQAWMLGGMYDFQTIKLSAVYGQTRGGSFLGQPAGTGAAGGALLVNTTLDAGTLFAAGAAYESYLLGLNMPLGESSIIFSWQMMRPAGEFATKGELLNTQKIYSAGYLYSFTKRTNLYTYVSYANNFSNVNAAQSTMIGTGVRHQF